ncbi:hypothetical protein [Micromonospora sediminicola]|uniref:hypothetical protein n=1 Tax=Micromonospora sediminicola TaxID=946078 RepID=UPI0037BCD7FA
MSLDIAVWVPSDAAHAGRVVVADPPGTSTAVGTESVRHQLWGSAAARRLGATILPQMRHAVTRARAVGGGVVIW